MEIEEGKIKEHLEKGKFLYKKGMLDAAIEEYKAVLRIDADFVEAHYNLGKAFLKKEMLDEARKEYEEALRIDPTYVNARFNLETVRIEIALREGEKGEVVGKSDKEKVVEHIGKGVFLAEKGMLDEAIKEFKEALKINPNYAPARYNLENALSEKERVRVIGMRDNEKAKEHFEMVNIFTQKGMLEEAIKEFKEALKKDPNNADLHTHLGSALAGKGMFDEAINELKEALRIDPNNYHAHASLGAAFSQEGMLDEAIKEFKEVAKINPNSADAHGGLGLVFSKKGRWDEAIREFKEALRINPNDPATHYNLGRAFDERAFLNKSSYAVASAVSDEAIEEYKASLRLDSDFVDAHICLGQAFIAKRMLDDGIKEFRDSVRINPNYAKAHFNLGLALAMKGLMNEAINEFEETLRIDPNNHDARRGFEYALKERGTAKNKALEHFLRAESLSKEGLLDDALKEYKQGLEISPNYIAAHNNLGNILLAKGMVEEAIKEFEEALRIDSNIADVHICLGNALYKKGMIEESVREYKKASKIDPNNVATHINLGSLFAMEGMIDDAISEYEEALKINPNNTIARNSLEHTLKEKKMGKYRIQKLPKDIEREYEKFLGKKKGIKLDIVSVHDLPQQSIILLKPDRNLSSEERTLRPYIKAKLLCEMPRAISSLNNKDLALIRTTPTLVTSADRKEFHQPGWTVKWRGHTIGPLSFMMDWDEDEQLFLAGLYEIAFKIRRVVSKEYQNQEFSVIKQIARAYRDEIKRIEI